MRRGEDLLVKPMLHINHERGPRNSHPFIRISPAEPITWSGGASLGTASLHAGSYSELIATVGKTHNGRYPATSETPVNLKAVETGVSE